MVENDLILNIADVCYSYPRGGRALDSLSFSLRRGEKVGIVGYNGSGKTTFFHLLMGLRKPESGRIEVFGRHVVDDRDFVAVRQRIGLLFQDADDQLFCPTVLEDVAFGPLNQGKTPAAAQAIASRVLETLGLAGFEERITHQLSGGEKKLVSLATVLAMEPEILLLDEPTTGLDEETKNRIVHVLNSLDLSYIVISHELDFLGQITDKAYTMRDGKIAVEEAAEVHSHYHTHPLGTYPHAHEK